MINYIGYANSGKQTTYKCDNCGLIAYKSQIKGIGVTNDKHQMIKKWDLCLKCYHIFEQFMAKGFNNER